MEGSALQPISGKGPAILSVPHGIYKDVRRTSGDCFKAHQPCDVPLPAGQICSSALILIVSASARTAQTAQQSGKVQTGETPIAFSTVTFYSAGSFQNADASVPVPAKHAGDYLRLAELVKSSNMETAWQDHRKPTHPTTFWETNTLLRSLIATRRNLLISPKYSKDTAEICPRCVRTPPFQLADPNVVLSLLGYC
jgi:hypothetical protein